MAPAGKGNRYELRAPFDAVVVEKHLTVGEVVDETSNAFTLSDLSRVWATFAVAPRDLDKVVSGRGVTVSAPDLGAQVEGKVNYVGSLLGEQNRAATVRATLSNPNGAWRPGLFVNIAVTVERFDAAVVVPESALQTWEEQTVVFARTDEGSRPAQSSPAGVTPARWRSVKAWPRAPRWLPPVASSSSPSWAKARPNTATDRGRLPCSNV